MPTAVPTSRLDVLRVISLSRKQTEQQLADELLEAANEDGFFYLVDHGIPPDLVDKVFAQSQGFFLGAPQSEKVPGNGDTGYTGFRQEALSWFMPSSGDLKESFFYADASWPAAHGEVQSLPPTLDEARAVLDDFTAACKATADRLLRGLATALQWEKTALSRHHSGQHNRLRLLHYPAVPADYEPADPNIADVRAGAHTDLGSLTLLFQRGVSGLQVRRNGAWLDVPPKQDVLVVNIGDALEFWSGAKLRSTVHRVVMPRNAAEQKSRFSIAFFIQADDETMLEPLKPDGVSPEQFGDIIQSKGIPRDTARISAGDYKRMRVTRAQRQSAAK